MKKSQETFEPARPSGYKLDGMDEHGWPEERALGPGGEMSLPSVVEQSEDDRLAAAESEAAWGDPQSEAAKVIVDLIVDDQSGEAEEVDVVRVA